MKTIILAAVAAMSLGVGAAYAAGGPVGFADGTDYQGPASGTQAFADHRNKASVGSSALTLFLGRCCITRIPPAIKRRHRPLQPRGNRFPVRMARATIGYMDIITAVRLTEKA